MLEKVSQSLAGRVYVSTLLPLSLEELESAGYGSDNYEDFLHKGLYPRVHDAGIDPVDWYPSYTQTYLERDVRFIKNITDLTAFQVFLKMCASRTGQLLNLTSLANDCGISHNTAKSWLSVLEASFVVFLLRPHHKNFGKRLVKMPKLYFYDPGLVTSLLGIRDKQQIAIHSMKGPLFETFVVSELIKYQVHRGHTPSCYFWRDKTGTEIDCLIETPDKLIPIEIKAGKTVVENYFENLRKWNRLSGGECADAYVIYGGRENQNRREAKVLSWMNIVKACEHV